MEIGNIADLINEEAMKDLTNGIVIEQLNTTLIDNAETIKKIEEKRKFVSTEGNKQSFGLTQNPPFQAPSKSTSETVKTTSTTSSGYSYSGYGYQQQRQAETIESKAREFGDKVFKRAVSSINNEKKAEQTRKNNWNIFELEERKSTERTIKKMSKKEKRKKERHDALKVATLKAILSVSKAIVESLYIKLK